MSVSWLLLVNAVVKQRIPMEVGKLLISSLLPSRTVLSGVSNSEVRVTTATGGW